MRRGRKGGGGGVAWNLPGTSRHITFPSLEITCRCLVYVHSHPPPRPLGSDGWSFGRLLRGRGRREGWFPSAFVERVVRSYARPDYDFVEAVELDDDEDDDDNGGSWLVQWGLGWGGGVVDVAV